MPRRITRTAIPVAAAAIAAAIGVGVIGSPVGTADAARPFSVTKSQFTTVKKNATKALDTSKKNAKAITELQQSGVAGPQGIQGLPGGNGGFDPAKVTRVVGPTVPVPVAEDYVPYALPCPAGTIVLSGGWYMSSGAAEKSIRVPASRPNSNLDGWYFRFAYSGAGTANLIPYAVCAGA